MVLSRTPQHIFLLFSSPSALPLASPQDISSSRSNSSIRPSPPTTPTRPPPRRTASRATRPAKQSPWTCRSSFSSITPHISGTVAEPVTASAKGKRESGRCTASRPGVDRETAIEASGNWQKPVRHFVNPLFLSTKESEKGVPEAK